jgi:hypothetical protein
MTHTFDVHVLLFVPSHHATSITRLSGVHCKDRGLFNLCHGDFGTILVVIWCFGQAGFASAATV